MITIANACQYFGWVVGTNHLERKIGIFSKEYVRMHWEEILEIHIQSLHRLAKEAKMKLEESDPDCWVKDRLIELGYNLENQFAERQKRAKREAKLKRNESDAKGVKLEERQIAKKNNEERNKHYAKKTASLSDLLAPISYIDHLRSSPNFSGSML